MIFPKTNNKTPSSEEGVSLMLSILILSAVMAVAFSLATIVLIELRSSRDASRTEPTLYGAFGVTEEALFQYKRFYSPRSDIEDLDVANCEGPGTCFLNGVDLSLPGEQPISFDESPRVEFIAAGSTKTIPMYVAEVFEQRQYESVTLQVLPQDGDPTLDFYFKVTNSDGSTFIEGQNQANTFGPTPFTGFGRGQYELILDNSSATSSALSVSIVTIRDRDADPDGEPAGLPFVGEQVLRIRADYQGLNRTYQVRIPIP